MDTKQIYTPHHEPLAHRSNHQSKLNWLRAAVLGANDGIVSTAGLVVGVAGATNDQIVIATAGIAGIIAGAISMAAGEYVSVSSSRDTERALLEKEKQELIQSPEAEQKELAQLYQAKGLSKKTAARVAKELTDHDAFRAHAEVELGIDPDNLTDPWHAAMASAASFTAGASIPLLAIILPPGEVRVPVAFISVVTALILTGTMSAKVGGADALKATIRVVLGGIIAMLTTYGIGSLFHVRKV